MTADRMKMTGVVRGGVVVPNSPQTLPEGLHVEISFVSAEIPQELIEEFSAWNRASDEAWELIETWEQEAKV